MERLTIRGQDGKAYWVDARCAGGGYRMTNDKRDQARLDRCAAYEDTGLEPGEICAVAGLASAYCAKAADAIDKLLSDDAELDAYRALGPIDHLREMVQAERDGRLVALPTQLTFSGVGLAEATELVRAHKDGRCVVLPSRPIAARYDVADMLQDDLKESAFSDPSVGIFGLTWAESELWQAIVDGLNMGRAEAEAAQGGGGDE